MAVQPIKYKRGGKGKTGPLGITAEGKSSYFMQTDLPEGEHNQRIHESVIEIRIYLDPKKLTGEVVKIETVHAAGRLSENGVLQEDTVKESGRMLSRDADIADLVQSYAEGILRSVVNGKVEAIDGFVGKKVFNPVTGALLTYTEAEENEPPSGGYYGTTTT